MSTSTYVGNPDVMIAGAPPPPPPPPPVSGQIPAMKINTVETAATKKPYIGVNNDVYEPPAAIQNAMLTKDKKPFTYTPGMGGKLDLSQIRSPRMARRVAKNANDEGIEGPPKSALESKPSPTTNTASNLFVQPQIVVPVFPTNIPPQPQVNKVSQSTLANRTPSNAADRQLEMPKNVMKIDTKTVPPAVTSKSSTPESPNTPTQITLAKAPTPWLQNKNKPQEDLPEWAKRTSINKAANDTTENAVSQAVFAPIVQPPQYSQAKQKEQEQQQPAQQSQPSSPYQCQPKPQFQQPRQSEQPAQRQHRQSTDPAISQRVNSQPQAGRIIPIRIEDRPSVFDAKCETDRPSSDHQFKQTPTLHHQQRWGHVSAQHSPEIQAQNSPLQNQNQTRVAASPRAEPVGTYIIPLVVEGDVKRTTPSNVGNNVTTRGPKVVQQITSIPVQQYESAPVQSRSFRVLQKITDTDSPSNDTGAEQIRKLELSEDERVLMNKFKEQVDHEIYLHQEADPRYRGAAIPSRAFRFLQNMTDSTDAAAACAAPRNIQNIANKKNRNLKSFEETQDNLPPSEQQVQEPKKYMGSSIPSRSFRILQAMTAPESIATQENRQADYTCRTQNNLPGNQQDVLLPSQPIPFWYPQGWWSYYPVQYNVLLEGPANETDKHSFPSCAYPQCPNGNMYVEYEPLDSHDYERDPADVARTRVIRRKNSLDQYTYEAVCPQSNRNVVHRSHVNANGRDCVRDRLAVDSFDRDDKCSVKNGPMNEPENGVPKRINHLDAQPCATYDCRHVVGESDSGGRDRIVTSMNITDEENVPTENIPVSGNVAEAFEKKFGLHVNIPNYTYVDTSDSSASSDSSDSGDSTDDSDDDSYRRDGSGRSNNDTTSNNTSSDSDSGSYVVYSTSLNTRERKTKEDSRVSAVSFDSGYTDARPESWIDAVNRERSLDDAERIPAEEIRPGKDRSGCRSDPDFRDERDNAIRDSTATKGRNENHDADDSDVPSDKTDSDDRESDAERRDRRHCVGDSETGATPDRSSCVVRKNAQPRRRDSSHCENKGNIDGENGASFEATDDSPDNSSETTVVSVALPLRFRFFVSENNEDVTTVTVGDSKIKTEKSRDTRGERSTNDVDKVNDVCVSFHVGNDTSVDFTIKRNNENTKTDARDRRNTAESKTTSLVADTVVPCVNFTLRKDPTNGGNYEEHAEATVASTTEDERTSSVGSASLDADDSTVSESMVAARNGSSRNEDRDDAARNDLENDLDRAEDETREDVESKINVPAPGCPSIDATSSDDRNCWIVRNDEDRCVDADVQRRENHLPSVSDPRKDTDDEDSGITSDITRAISEADTDSECITFRDTKMYQRTQTHSRLFRLLNDDPVPSPRSAADAAFERYTNSRSSAVDRDDNHGYAYNGGPASPECIRKQPRRRFHTATAASIAECPRSTKINRAACRAERATSPCKDDPYFRAWKDPSFGPYERDAAAVVPSSLAFKTLQDGKVPARAYRANVVLCPRIKSAKSVPQTLLASNPPTVKTDDPSIAPSIPTPNATVNTANYC